MKRETKKRKRKPAEYCTGRTHEPAYMLVPQNGVLLPLPICTTCGRSIDDRRPMTTGEAVAVCVVLLGLLAYAAWALCL